MNTIYYQAKIKSRTIEDYVCKIIDILKGDINLKASDGIYKINLN
jgi:hypothetical protein